MTTEFNKFLSDENESFNKTYSEARDLQVAEHIVMSAEAIRKSLSSLSESHGRVDFVLVITKGGDSPVKNTQIGTIEDLENKQVKANLNASVLKVNQDAISSSEIFRSPEGVGAISVGGWIISVFGFNNPKMNTATALGIAFGSKLINYYDAEKLAHDTRINCVSEYMEREFAFTDPFLK